jgi:hypothetical protein
MTSLAPPPIKDLLPKTITPLPPCPPGMRTFTVFRQDDETGVSGTGIVIQGVRFANGKCAIQWLCDPDPGDTQIKDWEGFLRTHIESHPKNKTIITFGDGEQIISTAVETDNK